MQKQIDLNHTKDWQTSLHDIFCLENVKSFFTWSQELQDWIPQKNLLKQIDFFSNRQVFQNHLKAKTNQVNKQLTSVTLNVLFDFRSSQQPDKDRGHMKFSDQRYQSILAQLQKMQCDIITLNEVTRPFVKLIEQTDWVRKNYKISTVHHSTSSIKCFGNIIITKLIPLALHVLKVSHLPRPIPIGFFLVQNKTEGKQIQMHPKRSIVTFSSIHLTAYDINSQRRQKQLTAIKKYLDSYNGCVDQHFLQGDMNFHSENQNIVAQNNQLSDSWFSVHKIQNQKDLSENPGYTFDAITNFFTKELYWGFQKRRMRLDRIFYSNHAKNVMAPVYIKVVFNEPIYSERAQEPSYNILKSSISFLGDKMKFNLFRNKEKYLFCSDHFGLLCKLQINN